MSHQSCCPKGSPYIRGERWAFSVDVKDGDKPALVAEWLSVQMDSCASNELKRGRAEQAWLKF